MKTRTKILITAAMLGVVGVLIAIGTSAFFSDTVTSDVNVAGTGNLQITDCVPEPCTAMYFTPGAVLLRPLDTLDDAFARNNTATGTATITHTGTVGSVDLRLRQTEVGGTSVGEDGGVPDLTDPQGANPDVALFNHLRLCIDDDGPYDPLTNSDCDVYGGASGMGVNPFDVAPVAGDLMAGDAVNSAWFLVGNNVPNGGSIQLYFTVWMQDTPNLTDNDYQDQTAGARFQIEAN